MLVVKEKRDISSFSSNWWTFNQPPEQFYFAYESNYTELSFWFAT